MLSEAAFRQLPIFITTMSRWDGDISSASLALAKVFSRRNPVYYIDYPYSYTDAWRERRQETVKKRMQALLWGTNPVSSITGQPRSLRCATPRLVVPFYSLPKGKLYRVLSHHNNKVLAGTIKKIIKDNDIKEYLFLNSFNPSYLSHIGRYLQPALSIYQSRDAIEEITLHALHRENECVQQYDLALATSRQLCRNIAERNHRPVRYFPNGGDVSLFKTALEQDLPRPAELQGITTPIIGYTGAICQRIDYSLLLKVARAHPDKTIVLVGPRKDKQFTEVNLDAVPNIVFTGPKKLHELPAFLRCFECAIIPFRYTTLTAGIYPLKLNEYLAAGRAVVSTNFSEDLRSFQKDVYLADSHEEFLQQLQVAIKANSPTNQQQRLQAAVQNDWESRVSVFWELAWQAYQQKATAAPSLK